MKNPATEWKHWATWLILTTAVTFASFFINSVMPSLLLIGVWFILIAFFDTIAHYARLQ